MNCGSENSGSDLAAAILMSHQSCMSSPIRSYRRLNGSVSTWAAVLGSMSRSRCGGTLLSSSPAGTMIPA